MTATASGSAQLFGLSIGEGVHGIVPPKGIKMRHAVGREVSHKNSRTGGCIVSTTRRAWPLDPDGSAP